MDYVLSRPIYAYPYTINLTYYDSTVLLAKNSFSHEKSQMLWEKAGQPDQEDNQMSQWPDVVLLSATRWL